MALAASTEGDAAEMKSPIVIAVKLSRSKTAIKIPTRPESGLRPTIQYKISAKTTAGATLIVDFQTNHSDNSSNGKQSGEILFS